MPHRGAPIKSNYRRGTRTERREATIRKPHRSGHDGRDLNLVRATNRARHRLTAGALGFHQAALDERHRLTRLGPYESVVRWTHDEGLSHENAVERYANATGTSIEHVKKHYAHGRANDPTVRHPGEPRKYGIYRQVKALLAAGHSKDDAVTTVVQKTHPSERTIISYYSALRAADPLRLSPLGLRAAARAKAT